MGGAWPRARALACIPGGSAPYIRLAPQHPPDYGCVLAMLAPRASGIQRDEPKLGVQRGKVLWVAGHDGVAASASADDHRCIDHV